MLKVLKAIGIGLVALVAMYSLLVALSLITHEQEAAKLSVKRPAANTPEPSDRELHLWAGDVDVCQRDSTKVVDVGVDETSTEVVVEASLEIDEKFVCQCESRSTEEPFVVPLESPLGDRIVIDDSRDEWIEIWSPRMRERFERRRN